VAPRALEFAILTAARTGEVMGARWGEIDLARKVWTIPPTRMKAGKEHRVPLSARAVAILEEMEPLRRRGGQEDADAFLFPGSKPGRPVSHDAAWKLLRPQLFGAMFKRGEVDGTGGFTNSNVPAILEMGFTMDDLFVLKYSDFGADMYGVVLVTRKNFADDNPGTTRAVVKALNQGTKDTIADPQKALDLLKTRDVMMKTDIEKIRLDIALGLTDTPHVAQYGLSSVTSVYTDHYLPPLAERMAPKRPN
jgi:hypothetical protein